MNFEYLFVYDQLYILNELGYDMSKECVECGAICDDTLERCPICASDLPRSLVSETRIKMDRKKIFLTGMKQVRYALLGLIIEAIIYGVFTPISIGLISHGFSSIYSAGVFHPSFTSHLLISLRYVIIAVVVTGIAVAIVLRMGFANMTLVDSSYRNGSTGSLLEAAGLIILIPGVFITLGTISSLSLKYFSASAFGSLASNIYVGAALLVLGGVLLLVGAVMVASALYKLGSQFDNGIVKIGAVFYFILGFIGTILLFFGFSSIMRGVGKARKYTTQAKPSKP